MDGDEKKMLEDTFELAQDNNKMLKHIRNSQRWASLMRVIYWAIIIAASVGSYYFIQPYITEAQKIMKDSGTALDKVKSVFPQ